MFKKLFLKYKFLSGVLFGIMLLAAPPVLALLAYIPSLIYPNDCDITARCQHVIVEIANEVQFGMLIFGPLLMLTGASIIVLFCTFYGIGALKRKDGDDLFLRKTKLVSGLLSGVLLLYLVYIPSGPDQCSRVFTDDQYESCLVELFSEKTAQQSREWLVSAGYRLSEKYYTGSSSLISEFYETDRPFKHDYAFEGYRNHGRGNSIPYGTNFNRLFGRIPPAPTQFEIVFFGVDSADTVFGAKAKWSFSFL
ncbi:MAG: hypothetical protein JKY74_07045 [Shewanella sp.]|nr:hypothetical protein [Shewanella sp.]